MLHWRHKRDEYPIATRVDLAIEHLPHRVGNGPGADAYGIRTDAIEPVARLEKSRLARGPLD